MEEQKQEQYRIAEFARMVGLDPSTVRYYQKHGLPERKRDGNGYRVFDHYDAFMMNYFRGLCARGFSINESIKMIDGTSRAELIQRLRENREEMDRELILLSARRLWTEETLRILERVEKGEDLLWRARVEDLYFLPASVGEDFALAQKNSDLREFWEDWLGCTRTAGTVDAPRFAQGERLTISWGETVTATDFAQLGYPADDTVQKLKMGDCLCFYAGRKEPEHITLADYPEVERYLKEHDLRARGTLVLSFLGLNVVEDGRHTGIAALPVEPGTREASETQIL